MGIICNTGRNDQKKSDDNEKESNTLKNIYSKCSVKTMFQLTKCICKIINNNFIGTGFFVDIPINENTLHCLITNNTVVTNNEVLKKESIKIIYTVNNEDETNRYINLDKDKRKIFIFSKKEEYFSVIEIIPSDEIDTNKFLNVFKSNINEIENKFLNKNIFLLHIPETNVIYETGNIINIKYEENKEEDINDILKKCKFIHNINTDKNSLGSPIFFDDTSEVVGVHLYKTPANENIGVFMDYIIYKIISIINLEEKLNANVNKTIEFENHKYEGFVNKENKPDGKGIIYLDNGEKYDGDFVNGVRTGKGIFYFSDENIYEGDFKDNKMEGKGTFYYNCETFKGDKYEGDWLNGHRTGKGIYYYASGDKYEGEFLEDKKNGFGIYNFKDGNRYEGEWKDNMKNGKGVIYFVNGTIDEGEFLNDKKTGSHKITYSNGKTVIKQYSIENNEAD